MKLHFFIFLIVLLSAQQLLFSSDYMVRNADEIYISVLKISHFNDDTAKDTLIGLATKNGKFKPRYIKWGKDPLSIIPQEKLVDYTEISYPSSTWSNASCTWTDPSRTWSDLNVATNIFDLNQDDITDLILIMWGKVQDGTSLKDTAVALTIFGQSGLDTISIIYTADIDTLQSTPFYAKAFRHGTELTEGKIRDLSRIPSYKVNKITIEGLNVPGPGNSGTVEVKNELERPFIKVYPNPASNFANIEFQSITPGEYSISILSLQGIELTNQKIIIKDSNNLIEQIKFDNLATGYYVLQVSNNKMMIGTFQIVILH